MSFQSSAFQSGAFQLEFSGAGAGQSTCVVTGTLSATGGGAVDFTKSGFGTPTGAVIVICGGNATNNPGLVGRIGIGFWDGTNQRALGIAQSDNVTTTSTFKTANDAFGVVVSNPSSNESDFTVSAVTDGIRITLTVDQTTTAIFCTVWMITGVSAKLVTITANATENNTTESASLGFAPKLVLFGSVFTSAADLTGSGSSEISFGAAEIGGTHRALSFSSVTAVADEVANIILSETRFLKRIINNGEGWGGETTTWGADTFTMTTRDAAATSVGVCFGLALGGNLSYTLGTITTPTSTGVATVPTTGITPESAIIALSTASGTTLETDADANGYSIGMLDVDDQAAHNFSVEDAAATTNCNSRYSASVPILLDTSAAGTASTIIQADLDSLDGDGFDLNYSVVDSVARKGWFLAFGPTFVAGGFVPYPRPRGKIGGMSSWSGGMHP